MGREIRTVIFDLDGTIYQNIDFYGLYVKNLVANTPYSPWESQLCTYLEGVFCGKKLTMNAFYPSTTLKFDSFEGYIRTLEAAGPVEKEGRDEKSLIYLGDAWAVLTLVGKTMGLLDGERCNEVYKLTRNDMSRLGMHGDMRLKDAIVRLGKRYNTVLLSNSYEETAKDFLSQLGFENVFSACWYSANKPFGMIETLKSHDERLLDNPENILTIGDHAYNDLFPLMELGADTLWINPYHGINEPPYGHKVATTEELADYLDRL